MAEKKHISEAQVKPAEAMQADSAYQSALIGILDDTNAEATATQKAELRKKLEYMRERDQEKVKGVFRYHQKPGQTLQFTFYNYKGDKLENYKMTDGMAYEVRRDVARHLNKEGLQPIYEWVKDEVGKPVMEVTRYLNRCAFDSMDFFELEDIMPSKRILRPHRILAPQMP